MHQGHFAPVMSGGLENKQQIKVNSSSAADTDWLNSSSAADTDWLLLMALSLWRSGALGRPPQAGVVNGVGRSTIGCQDRPRSGCFFLPNLSCVRVIILCSGHNEQKMCVQRKHLV